MAMGVDGGDGGDRGWMPGCQSLGRRGLIKTNPAWRELSPNSLNNPHYPDTTPSPLPSTSSLPQPTPPYDPQDPFHPLRATQQHQQLTLISTGGVVGGGVNGGGGGGRGGVHRKTIDY
ncbi:hypothetical protein M0802_015999 [Mischocyttarus mexicanus]|nr:hypothetical protein M0802_015999 [Mischocyttarus mexicanus]